jgi:hypothetical protein
MNEVTVEMNEVTVEMNEPQSAGMSCKDDLSRDDDEKD